VNVTPWEPLATNRPPDTIAVDDPVGAGVGCATGIEYEPPQPPASTPATPSPSQNTDAAANRGLMVERYDGFMTQW
jgi:hypothetical protein